MKYTLFQKVRLTVLCMVLGLGFSLVPALAQKTSTSFSDVSLSNQVEWYVLEEAPDSEWALEDQPHTANGVMADAVGYLDYEQPDSEWALEDQPACQPMND